MSRPHALGIIGGRGIRWVWLSGNLTAAAAAEHVPLASDLLYDHPLRLTQLLFSIHQGKILDGGTFSQGRVMVPRASLGWALDKGHVPLLTDASEVGIPMPCRRRGKGRGKGQLLPRQHVHAVQDLDVLGRWYFYSGVVDFHALVGEVAPSANAYDELAGGIVVDDVPGVVPHHLALPAPEQLAHFLQGRGAGVVGEVQRVESPVRRREEVEARVGERQVELVVLYVGGPVGVGYDVRVTHPSPAPVPGLHALQDDGGSGAPAHTEPVLVPGHDVIRRVLDQAGVNGILACGGPAKCPNVHDNRRIRSGRGLAGSKQGEKR